MSINRDKYDGVFKTVRPQVLLRDGNRCVKCGLTLDLEVHHIDGYKNNDLEKLATLCYFCHGIAPMGKDLFEQWLLLGEDGVDVIRRRLAKNGLRNMKREHIIVFCSTLSELRFDMNKSKMNKGRERMRLANGKCEGRHAFGYKDGERDILEKMNIFRAEGKTYQQIADIFNMDDIQTRTRVSWRASVVGKILLREKRKETA